MQKATVWKIWAGMYCLCAALGFIPHPAGLGKGLLVAVSLLFFLPPFYLARLAMKEESRKTLSALRLISGGMLALSLILLVLNFLSVYLPRQAGVLLYVLWVMFTAPMACGQYWFLSLFLWACLWMFTLLKPSPYQK